MTTEIETLREENERLRAKITELSALSRENALLHSVLSALPVFVLRTDPALRVRFINRLAEGFTLEQTIGSSIYDYIHPNDIPIARACIERVQETRTISSYQASAMGDHGQARYYDTIVVPAVEDDERVSVCLVAVDITQLKEQERALRASQEKLSLAIQSTAIGLWSWDAQTNAVWWDQRMFEITGYDKPLPLSEYIQRLVHPEDRDAVSSGDIKNPDWKIHRIIRPDGKIRWILPSGSVIRDESGEIIRIDGGQLDITEQKSLEARLLQSQRMDAVGRLTSGIAHNFNNMLAAILPSLELLMDVVPAEERELVSDASHAARRAAEMVKQLMTFAGQRPSVYHAPANIEEIVSHAVMICQRVFDRHITLTQKIEPNLPRVSCDAGAIEQVLVNLLLNARDAVLSEGEKPPHISVVVDMATLPQAPGTPAREHVQIRVSDNGTGIDKSVQAHIFEPFFTTKPFGRGTGLGLSTSYAIIKAHKGWIDCTSSIGEGTTFSIYLSTTEEGQGPALQHPTPAKVEKIKLLLVDDEDAVRRVTRYALQHAGYEVHVASSARAALQATIEMPEIKLVLLDRSMPEQPGSEIVGELRQRLPHAKLLYYTGQDVPSEEQTLLDGVLRKPLSLAELLESLRAVLAL